MPRIHPVTEQTPEITEIFNEIQEAFGRLPGLFSAYAHHPPLLRANWNKVKAVMMEGVLSRKVKESIAVLVSQDNSCAYCIAAHTGALRSIGVSDAELDAIEKDLDKTDFTAKEKALINFARQANTNPGKIPDTEFTALRETGATDAEIVEALGVMELFTAFNKFLDSMGVPVGS